LVTVASQSSPGDRPLVALARSLEWLSTHPPDPARDRLGSLALDAWAWYLFATFHPEGQTRARTGEEVDRRLRAIPPPAGPTHQTVVTLSYWALVLRLMQLRRLDLASHLGPLEPLDPTALIRTASPTTAWWIAALLRRVGREVGPHVWPKVEPDFSGTFIARTAAAPTADYVPTRSDAYRLFHEIVPATDLGREPLRELTPPQQAFASRLLPDVIRVSRSEGDTDAVAEALVSVALLDRREMPAYREALDWLLARQRPDGTYVSARDARAATTPEHYRHVVLVASWAVLTSAASAAKEPAAERTPGN
jgi:hypothetical protein